MEVATAEAALAVRLRGQRNRLVSGLVACGVVLLLACLVSIMLGTRDVSPATIWKALTDFDPSSPSETVIRDLRIPRTLIGIFAGAALGVSGAVLQAATRNPLADPGLLGINGGAAACIVGAIALFGTQSLPVYIWFGFLGAAVATLVVYAVAAFGREGATPVKLALAGAAISACLYALTTAIVMTNIEALDQQRFWQVGSLAGRYYGVFWQTLPFLVVGTAVALGSGRALNGLAMGDDVASALGMNVGRVRLFLFVTVAILCGAAVSACGPIVFLGLAVPQAVRALVGPDYRWVLAYTAVLSPAVLLLADVVGRLVLKPGELQVGVVLGVLGAPVLIALVRYKNLAEL